MKDEKISRRTLLIGGLSAAGLAALGSVTACTPRQQADNGTGNGTGTVAEVPDVPADRTESCDVVVVGVGGCSGSIAAAHAVELGLNVIGIDALNGFGAGNFCIIAGCMGIETEAQLAAERIATAEELFNHLYEASHYQMNPPLLSNIVHVLDKSCKMILDTGMPTISFFNDYAPDAPIDANMTMYAFTAQGRDRVPFLDKMIENVDARWGCEATKLLTDGTKVVGVRYTNAEGEIVDCTAKNVILGTGGFLQNQEMTSKYYGGCQLYCPPGNSFNNGSGINMALAVGAQMGKNFSSSGSALGGGNSKSKAQFAKYDPTECSAFTLCFLGGLYVNKRGDRIMKESSVTEGMMWAAEPMIRNDKWYVVVDQKAVDLLKANPIVNFMGKAQEHMAKGDMDLWNVVLSDIQESIETAIEEGWAWSADSYEELGEITGMVNLARTAERYNGYCRDGKDTQMFKDPSYLVELGTPPFYVLENESIGWLTMGGIKTDEYCRALNADEDIIEGLYCIGGDADLWSVPYLWGASTSGFGNAAGYIAAEACADNVLNF
jgi:fumarate reductase flavoprotein subunit